MEYQQPPKVVEVVEGGKAMQSEATLGGEGCNIQLPEPKLLALLRYRHKLSLRMMAKQMGFSNPYLWDIEHGNRRLTRSLCNQYLKAIADIEGLSLEAILHELQSLRQF